MADGAAPERFVDAPVNYLQDNTPDSIYYTSDPARGHLPLSTHTVRIRDVRRLRDQYTLDVQGIQLLDAPCPDIDFHDKEAAAKVFLPHMEDLLTRALGARKVVASGNWVHRYTERSPDFAATGTTYPARYVHIDYSDESGPSTARALLGDDPDADRLMAGRFMVLNTWRSLSAPPQDTPLALCDATSVAAADLIPSHVVVGPPGRERKLGTNMVEHNPNHRWIYFSGMHRDELLLFRGYDSDRARSRRVPHTAFDDPTAGPDAPARESIDLRVAVFFG